MNKEKIHMANSVSSCFNEFIQQKREENVSGRVIFRGLSNSKWNVLSSAARRLSIDDKPHCQRDFIRYHVNLIKHARRFGYGHFKPGYNLSDLEILAEIQHLGGATCLTDFSTNFLVALWFATAPVKDEKTRKECDGKIVWLDLSNPNNFSQIMYYTEERDSERNTIQQILTSYEFISHTKKQNRALPSFWIWEPSKLNVRIDKQESIFLFGLRKFPQQMDMEDTLRYREIIIPAEYKDQIREELDNFFGISAETVYHDLQGYATNSNGCNITIGKNILPRANCIDVAKNCIKTGEYSLAMSYLDQMIECFRQKMIKGQNNLCIKKVYKNLPNEINGNCCIDLGEVYYWRAQAVESRKDIETEEAILNYHEAISHFLNNNETSNVLLYDAYQNLIYLYYEIHDYDSALEEARKLWSIFSENKKNNMVTAADRDGHDSILSILELLIILNQKEEFQKYVEAAYEMKIVERFKYTNGAIMWILFRYLGKLIWSVDKDSTTLHQLYDDNKAQNWMDVIENIISNTIDNKDISKDYVSFVGYYYWDFGDLLEEIKKNTYNRPSTIIRDAVLLIEKADEAQGRLINHLLLINDAFE